MKKSTDGWKILFTVAATVTVLAAIAYVGYRYYLKYLQKKALAETNAEELPASEETTEE